VLFRSYSHAILPLCNERDLETEIRWGLDDFSIHFGREAEGMWLPETACDDRVLEALASAGMRFAVLAPRQAAAVRRLAAAETSWQSVSETSIDTSVAYLWRSQLSDRRIAVYFYDGAIARAIAFDRVLHSSAALVDRCEEAARKAGQLPGHQVPGPPPDRHTLVHAATDGESYGHHFAHGERCLAHAMTREAPARDFFVSNYARHLSEHPPQHEARLVAGATSWSCEHGVARWLRHCGCVTGAQAGDHQAWRAPLRAAFDALRDTAAGYAERAMASWNIDVWAVRNADHANRSDTSRRNAWLAAHVVHVAADDRERAHACLASILDMQRSALAMYTSCGWFFSDIAGIEARIVLRHAAALCQALARAGEGDAAEEQLVEALASAASHRPGYASGADVYRALV
jgi:alpha-amylase/alpha-mannosidase (GH57 family)